MKRVLFFLLIVFLFVSCSQNPSGEVDWDAKYMTITNKTGGELYWQIWKQGESEPTAYSKLDNNRHWSCYPDDDDVYNIRLCVTCEETKKVGDELIIAQKISVLEDIVVPIVKPTTEITVRILNNAFQINIYEHNRH